MTDRIPTTRGDYVWFHTISTRWMDNDASGHVNNATYYSFFDTAATSLLLDYKGTSPAAVLPERMVISSRCQYFAPVRFPSNVTVGVAVTSLGRSSVHYAVAVFDGEATRASAEGEFVHVFVDAINHRPQEMPALLRQYLETFRRNH